MGEQNRFPTPMEDRYIISVDETNDNEPVVYVPDEIKDKPKTGTIAAVGRGKQAENTGEWIEMQCEVGDKVLFGKFAGATITIDDVEYLLLKQSDILLIF